MSTKYKMQYIVKNYPDGISKDEAVNDAKEGISACDAMLTASILYPEDGSISVLFMSMDGRINGELADIECFKVWTMLGVRLANSKTLGPGQRGFCAAVMAEFVRSLEVTEPGSL